jgi:hypothetical protein
MRTPTLLARGLAAALLLSTAGATRAGEGDGFRCSDRGGPEWREIRSEHFVVLTDHSSRRAKDLARELETVHRAVRGALFRTPPPMPGLVRVVVFKRQDEFQTFAPEPRRAGERALGLYQVIAGEPTIVIPGSLDELQRVTLAHELAHHLLARIFARQPRWFAEGVATWIESVGVTGPDSPPSVGNVPPHRVRDVYPYHGGAGELLHATGGLPSARHYGVAWALVNYLMNVRGREFGALQARFQRGDDPQAAWRELFPEWDPASPEGMKALDKAVGQHVGGGKFAYHELKLEKDHPEPTERRLSASEVHGLRLALPRVGDAGKKPEVAARILQAEVEEVLAEDPGNVAALAIRTAAKPEEAAALAARATQAHPEDSRGWLLLAKASEGPARDAAFHRAVETSPQQSFALNELAWELVKAEREGEAIPIAVRAVAIAPWDGAVLDTLAAALQGVGRCAEALTVQRRASDVIADGASEEARKPIIARLEALEASCGAAKKPGSSASPAAP